jgi:putative peptidoglycan lipid II flippase
MLTQKTILKKTIQVGGSTLVSRFFGIIRDVLMIRYLGATGLSDAFLTAFKIPNSLRKIFAEGAVSATFTPTVVNIIKHEDQKAVSGLMSLAFLFFEGMVLILCMLIMNYAEPVLRFIAPGFSDQQISAAIPMLHILMPFIFFISSSALLGGALHAVGHFFTPAIAPVILNIITITGLCVSIFFNLPIKYLCWTILFSGLVHFVTHLIMYIKFNFYFGRITRKDFRIFGNVMGKFLLCLPSVSMMEVALFIDTSYASLLPAGSISLISYANRFVGIPLGVFAVAFSTILLPHFARISTYSKKRLHFYLFESAKFIFWVTVPIALLMSFFSREIFSTIFLSKKFTLLQVHEAGNILVVFTAGLFFFSINKILLNIFYSIHAAWVTALVSLFATALNILLNELLITQFQSVGLATATVISAITQAVLFSLILYKKYNFRLYLGALVAFALRYMVQLALFGTLFVGTYYGIVKLITSIPSDYALFFINAIGLWLWVGPLALIFLFIIFRTRKLFKIKLHFLP